MPRGTEPHDDKPDVKSGTEKASRSDGTQPDKKNSPTPRPEAKPGSQQGTPEHPDPADKDGEQPKPGDGLRKLADQLSHLAKQPQDAAAARKEAQNLNRQAQELLRNATPEQREQLKKWGQQMAKDTAANRDPSPGSGQKPDETPPSTGPGTDEKNSGTSEGGPHGPGAHNAGRDPRTKPPTRTVPIDARAPAPPTPAERAGKIPDRVIAEWYANKKPDRADPGSGPLTPEAEQSIREATAGGERAVDNESVPTRYDSLLRKYFQRLGERAKASPAPAADAPPARPTQPAQDAPTRSPAPKP